MNESDSILNSLLEDSERLLLQGDYFSAEKCSRKALTNAARLTDEEEKHQLGDRAAAVLLQALFETNRFSNARPSLIHAFGSMETTPPNSVLVWLSLALDTDEKSNAQTLMLNLLQAGPCRGAPVCRWNHRQYLALIHLYAIEVLLPALRDPSEVRLWLQRQPFLPLDPREKQFLEDEVEAAAVAASLAAENGGGDSSSLNANIGGLEPTGSTDLDHIIGGGGGGRSRNTTASKNNRNSTTNIAAASGGGALDTGRKRTDYSSMHLPSDHISPMKKSPNQNTKNNTTTSPAVAIATADQQNNPYLMSFSPVPSNLPFGTLAEYENEHGHHHHQQASSSISSPVHPSTLSPRPSGDLHSAFSSRNSNTATTSTANKQQQGEKNGNDDDVAIDLDWLGKVQQTAFEVAGSVYSTINELIVAGKDTSISGILNNKPGNYPKTTSEQPSNGGGRNVEGSMVTLATVAGASIFAYAMYTERVLIKNSAKRAWRGVEDLVKIALLFTPNPMS